MDVFPRLVRAQVEVDVFVRVRSHAPAADIEPDNDQRICYHNVKFTGYNAKYPAG